MCVICVQEPHMKKIWKYMCVFGQGRRGLTIPKDSYKMQAHCNLLSNFTELPVHAKGMVVKWLLWGLNTHHSNPLHWFLQYHQRFSVLWCTFQCLGLSLMLMWNSVFYYQDKLKFYFNSSYMGITSINSVVRLSEGLKQSAYNCLGSVVIMHEKSLVFEFLSLFSKMSQNQIYVQYAD